MDSSSHSQPFNRSASSPRTRELQLQGPRPAPLRVRKDSHKVRKPPIAPPSHLPQPNNSHQQRTAPVIIYTISPKVIHTNPDDFMNLVHQLTGACQTGLTSSENFDNSAGASTSRGGLISPAARYAVMDKIKSYQQSTIGEQLRVFSSEQDDIILVSSNSSPLAHTERSNSRQFVPSGILSPGLASLAVPNSFFSPLSSDPNAMSSFFQGLSPLMNQQLGNNFKNIFDFTGNINYQQSPRTSNWFLSPSIISPTSYSLDLFNNFGDL